MNLKKFCALHWAKDHYEYCAAIDCDTIFKDKNATHAFFSDAIKNYEKNIFFGGTNSHSGYNEILKACSKYLPNKYSNKLETLTQKFTVYPWFFDVPLYQNKDLIAFFEVMNHQNDNLNNFWNNQNWYSFEHIIFVYFKLIYQNAKLINYSTEVKQNVPEGLNLKDLINIKYRYNYLTTWVRLSSVIEEPTLLQGENIHMIYHIDRI
ncbi:hypothetical protein G9F31_06175 [Acinetobacter sp. 187]|uniref:hypothetical protein n=1 Tax=Acinetobacter lanii TaxID=2715163 RepID=UPI00140D34D1|nr:hypothetical protein [Acinetobacter lanii]NHC03353.1 hypothetical protein [Acinetobacter lanii]